jgi:hypothetical protein
VVAAIRVFRGLRLPKRGGALAEIIRKLNKINEMTVEVKLMEKGGAVH